MEDDKTSNKNDDGSTKMLVEKHMRMKLSQQKFWLAVLYDFVLALVGSMLLAFCLDFGF